jgi:nickel superoxide dismutase
MRFQIIEEDIRTVEKSMKEIVALSKEGDKNYNQIVRWVNNKDEHAGRIQEVVHQYFMTQRLKPVGKENASEYRKYVEKLELLHQMLFYAMKAKQTTDLNYVEKLRSVLGRFRTAYFAQ